MAVDGRPRWADLSTTQVHGEHAGTADNAQDATARSTADTSRPVGGRIPETKKMCTRRASDFDRSPFSPAVEIHHPGYCEFESCLWSFRMMDRSRNGEWGVQFALVHTTAATLADNAFDGWFTDDEGKLVDACAHELIPAGKYYFHVPKKGDADTEDLQWPLLARFSSWRCPNMEDIPKWWKAPYNPIEMSSGASDRSCRVTGSCRRVKDCNIIPESQLEWFKGDDMTRFVGNSRWRRRPKLTMRSEWNRISLKSDLQGDWDDRLLDFVPKVAEVDGKLAWWWVLHVNISGKLELWEDYHNQPLREAHDIHPALLLARFAWSVLTRFAGCHPGDSDRWVVKRDQAPGRETDLTEDGKVRKFWVKSTVEPDATEEEEPEFLEWVVTAGKNSEGSDESPLKKKRKTSNDERAKGVWWHDDGEWAVGSGVHFEALDAFIEQAERQLRSGKFHGFALRSLAAQIHAQPTDAV